MIKSIISRFKTRQSSILLSGSSRFSRDLDSQDPILSVVVPCYKVESYLRGTLETILAQNEIPIEIIVVDDGSPDRSGEIARDYAENDPRIVVISQANAGLGAARNTGIRAAKGKYLTFADSDDYVPAGSYKAMVEQLETSGSDFVVGSVQRKRGLKTWVPEWAQHVHASDRIGGTLQDDPELLKDVFAWNKVFRRSFWDDCIGEFPTDIRYEDQAPTAKAYTVSKRFDVLKRVVYTWVIREDGTSITQQKAKIEDLEDRLEVMRAVADILQSANDARIFEEWVLKSIGFDLRPYYEQIPRTNKEYWSALREGVKFLVTFVPNELWNRIPFWERLVVGALLYGSATDVELIMRKKQEDGSGYAVVPDELLGLRVDVDFIDDLTYKMGAELLVPAAQSLRMRAELLGFEWLEDGHNIQIKFSAFISGMSPDRFDYQVTGQMVCVSHDLPPVDIKIESSELPAPQMPSGDAYNNYLGAGYTARINVNDFIIPISETSSDVRWVLQLVVSAGGLSLEGGIAGRSVLGSTVDFTHGKLSEGLRFAAHFDKKLGFVVNVPTRKPIASAISVRGRQVELVMDRHSMGKFDRVLLRSRNRRDLSFVASRITADSKIFSFNLPLHEESLNGSNLWEIRVANRHSSSLVQSRMSSDELYDICSKALRVRVSLSPNGFIRLEERDFAISVNAISYTDMTDVLTVSGAFTAPLSTLTRLFLEKNTGERILPFDSEYDSESRAFSLQFKLHHRDSTGRILAHQEGGYALKASRSTATLGTADVWVPVDASLFSTLPLYAITKTSRIRVSRTVKAGALWLNIYPRLEFEDATRFGQRRLIRCTSRDLPLEDATLFESFGGTSIGDSPLALSEAATAIGAGGKHYWTVRDSSVPAPMGTEAVVIHSAKYHELLASARWLVNNNNFPYYYKKRPGQTYVQTWHGTPLKRIGNDVPSASLSVSYRALMRRESSYWDFLLAQSDYAADKLSRAFGYTGPVLTDGYPRNDSLITGHQSQGASELRSKLGISPRQHVILYAPTWRDNVRTASNHYDLVSYLDFDALSEAFGSSIVVLLRGHSNTYASGRMFNSPNVIDVTRYPNINDLMLVSDSLITDYSSIMFDYCILDRPIHVLAPDIDDYSSSIRGFYYDFNERLPGGLYRSTAELIHQLKRDPVAFKYRGRDYAEEFAPRDDGAAAIRVARKIWT